METKSVEELLRGATILTGPSLSSESDARSPDLKSILHRRLSEYHEYVGSATPIADASLEEEKLTTASEALVLLEVLHHRLKATETINRTPRNQHTVGVSEDEPAMIGARDLALIRTLLSIVFRWAVEPLVQRIAAGLPTTSTSHITRGAHIIDLTGLPHEYSLLSSTTSRLLALPLSKGTASSLSQSAVTASLLNRHLSDLLLPCIIVGWLPKSLSSESISTGDALRPQVMHLLSRLPASQVISAVGQTLSIAPTSLPYTRKSCSFILSRQLMRPDGIRGFCESVFAEEEMSEEDAPLDKLEKVVRVLSAVPPGMKAEEYCNVVVPRMLLLLSSEDRALPPAHRRAIAFSLSRMLTHIESPAIQAATIAVVLKTLHEPVLRGSGEMSISAVLSTIQILLTNTDPSPDVISTLLTPIVPSIYALHAHLQGLKASDPVLRESLHGYLQTWGRLVGSAVVISTLWRIIGGEGGKWRVDVAGTISKLGEEERRPDPLSLFTPESLKQAEESGELDVDSNLLGLEPDPVRFVRFIKGINRPDVSSELFVRLLEGYRELRHAQDADPLRTLLYLQLVVQMQTQLSSDDTSSVLKEPEHILSFIKHALEDSRLGGQTTPSIVPSKSTFGLEDLRIVDEDTDDEGDSDDDESDEGPTTDDMTTTAGKLLLSVLEANPELSARSAPVLNDIFSLLEPLSRSPNEHLRSLAREARMVMTARLASTSETLTTNPAKQKSAQETESPQETYQKALKLLQDPLLPVRAHGLMLLRQLVSSRKIATGDLASPPLDRALIPGILSIFMQSIQDDDSYMFLNAVQGLSAMVDGYGKDVLRGLVRTYSDGMDGLGAGMMPQHDVDMRTRVGEALGQAIRRCGEALPSYAPLLVPPLFGVVRTSHFPTVLRSSAISLLAQCVRTNGLAVLPYVVDLTDAMVDLLQVESVSTAAPALQSRSSAPKEVDEKYDEDEAEESPKPTMEALPASTDTKFPPLRRSALHFLSLLIQAYIQRVYETGDADRLILPPRLMSRAKTTLEYIAGTDVDDVVRVMAKEAVEALDQLVEALVGL